MGANSTILIDPRTARPGGSDLAQATVVAQTAELADVLAKTAFLLGAAATRRLFERIPRASFVLVRRDGGVELAGAAEVVRE